MTDRTADLTIGDMQLELPIIDPTIGNDGLAIGKLRNTTGDVTFDPGFANTAGTRSSITYINGAEGILRHRGYAIEDLALNAEFLEVAYLLLFGELPSQPQLADWKTDIAAQALVKEEMKRFFDAFPNNAHPMAIMASATNAISTFYEEYHDPSDEEAVIESAIRLIAKMPTIAAWSYKKSMGMPYNYPRSELSYVENFLHMMFHLPTEDTKVDPVIAEALNVLFILHADHEQNCSTATVRGVGSSQANLFTSVAAGISALWGPLHGGANQQVIEMLKTIVEDPEADAQSMIARAKDPDDPFRLMGFGHRVYKNHDPRATVLRTYADEVLATVGVSDPLLEVAKELEQAALADDYFVERKLFPNVDFYSGIIFRALGFPSRMFTVLFSIGRVPGWIAQWKEMTEDPETRIMRPRQIYVGEVERDYVKLADR
ncbi:MAG: citrate synthase [Acidimicrobiia bacterium]|nr:MAG: citrate synthase [Acidimicrobiia bacterium]